MISRDRLLEEAEDASRIWDILVIGGGATGLGTALDAAARGYRTLLLEQSDFAKATSSRSTKLIHGGVRYLRQGDLPLLRESLRERGLLLRNAPHCVRRLPFVVPAYSTWDKPFYGIGLTIYDKLSGRWSLGPSRILSREETLAVLPALQPEGLRGGVRYFDAQFDDSRLALSLLQTFLSLGGIALNYVRVRELLKTGGRVQGASAEDGETGREYRLRARVVINATGIFTDSIRAMDQADAPPMMTTSQGVHLVLPEAFLPGGYAVMIPKTDDGRVLFAIPWHGRVLVGTTDTPVPGPVLDPAPLEEEIEFLLEHAGRYLIRGPAREDLLSVYAGIRPLARGKPGAKTSRISRNHVLTVSPSGLVTITGGKWTTYRQMAEDAVDLAAKIASLEPRACKTRSLVLQSQGESAGEGHPAGLRDLVAEQTDWEQPLHPALPYLRAEVIRAARWEMARTVEDVLARRLRALILNARAAQDCAAATAALLAQELGRDEAWAQQQTAVFRRLAESYLPVGQIPHA
ncbi:MAG TPA: glycerol-3-phosphate dehydrogenase/oxidase [Verrucomicrobiales bacterium]|nr:glycerol-3-phosphate dehydrogenase/oxidase [Verrucomicrobiales bacterium]